MMFSCLIFFVFISAIFGMAGAGETGLEREQSRNQSYALCVGDCYFLVLYQFSNVKLYANRAIAKRTIIYRGNYLPATIQIMFLIHICAIINHSYSISKHLNANVNSSSHLVINNMSHCSRKTVYLQLRIHHPWYKPFVHFNCTGMALRINTASRWRTP